MKTSTRWLLYSLARVGLFAGVFALLMVLGIEWWLSALFAMIIAFAISYLLLRETRETLAKDLEERRARVTADPDAEDPDAAAENAANEAVAGTEPGVVNTEPGVVNTEPGTVSTEPGTVGTESGTSGASGTEEPNPGQAPRG